VRSFLSKGELLFIQAKVALELSSELSTDGLERAVAGSVGFAVAGQSEDAVCEGDGVVFEGVGVEVDDDLSLGVVASGDLVIVDCGPEVVGDVYLSSSVPLMPHSS
jgi:hypothetical protein